MVCRWNSFRTVAGHGLPVLNWNWTYTSGVTKFIAVYIYKDNVNGMLQVLFVAVA